MKEIRQLLIGPWGGMSFTVGEINRTYGLCTKIESVQVEKTHGLNEYKEWQTTEFRWDYKVDCTQEDGKKQELFVNPETPGLVVVYTDEA